MSEQTEGQAAPEVASSQAVAEHGMPVVTPAADIREQQSALVLTLDLPGVDEQSLNVTLDAGVLTVEGKARPEAPEGYERVLAEYGAAHFRRVFQLSDRLDTAALRATLRHGVLQVTVPKREDMRARRVTIKAG